MSNRSLLGGEEGEGFNRAKVVSEETKDSVVGSSADRGEERGWDLRMGWRVGVARQRREE